MNNFDRLIRVVKKIFPIKKHQKKILPLKGYQNNRIFSGIIEKLSDDDLRLVNSILPWNCFSVDSNGRRFGDMAWSGKRDQPQIIPDKRILEMDRFFTLNGKTVLELGCFEGIHTIGLLNQGAKVCAVDSRIENLIKTMVRILLFEHTADTLLCDLDSAQDMNSLPHTDLVHHVGVLYHLKDPVSHLQLLGRLVSDGILLDTHYAKGSCVTETYTVGDKDYSYFRYREKGRDQVFAGMYDHAKWLRLEDILAILKDMGFSDINITDNVEQRNGLRVTLYAARPGVMKH